MNKNLISKIFQKIKKTPTDIAAYEDLFALCRNIEQEDVTLSHSTNEELRKAVTAAIKHRKNVEVFFELYKKTFLFDAPHFLIRIYFTLKSIVSRVNDFINPGARC